MAKTYESSTAVSDAQFHEDWYKLVNREEVLSFLVEHRAVLPLLTEAHTKIEIYFPEARLFLEVLTDPELADDVRLVLFIAPDMMPHEAFDKLKLFRQEWWLEASVQAKDKLSILVDYR